MNTPNPRRFSPLLAAREAFLRELASNGVPYARAELAMLERYRRGDERAST